MERADNGKNQYSPYPEGVEEISSMLAYVQNILSQLKTNNRQREAYTFDSSQLRKENEKLKRELSILKEVMNLTIQA